ncbi:MAG: hypothetical protein JXB15_07485 [Anaerolineales bacterium]|nr:hypothetical protein [Anaerolineales bacterium]
MLGIQYLKTTPTHYVMHYQRGRLKKAGTGLAFFYYSPASSITVIPIGSADVPFIFNETSSDFQPVTVQGMLSYRIHDPQLVASLLDFTVDGSVDKYASEDPQKLAQRLVNLLQTLVRGVVQHLPLREAIHASEMVASTVLDKFAGHPSLAALGMEVLSLSIQAIRPSPEMARALEAEAREELLRQADQAIYDRRNASVEQERRIKENELNTEVAVEEKKRQIRETKIAADLAVEGREQQVRQARLEGQIALEQERKRLVAARTENAHADADIQAYALEASLRPLLQLNPDLTRMLAVQSADPRRMVSMAFKDLAQNASRIGNLNISPELLETLLHEK